MTEECIKNNSENISKYGNVIENPKEAIINSVELIKDNKYNLEMCKKYNNRYILIDNSYPVEIELH